MYKIGILKFRIKKIRSNILLRKTVFTFFQIYGVNVIYAFYGVNAHENNHLLNEIKSSNRASLEQTLFTMNENI
ncbi:hypothetical protein BpHYR1_022683 [Brachionus plicatilis]|uniref:Uncharacterized protein n=1 Tax=Brachionus plicatilis TaxID=10195 RepID=A0A3M7SJ87_BRAPC|nr:hypothetical protein BpHYR1_022683 [Brachionus plicatilis]